MFLGKLGAVPKNQNKPKAVKAKKTKTNPEDKLWKWFSLYIRLRDCIDNTGGYGFCFTCGEAIHYKDGDCGHFIPRKWKPTKYREDNNNLQCKNCNGKLSGNIEEYAKRLGSDKVTELKEERLKPAKKMMPYEIESKIEYYRQKAKVEAYRVGVELK
ncbi:MAG: recombination protein NinG [Clostridia bacterium]|nr:recombination protein NinG [Clostridia bacterium]